MSDVIEIEGVGEVYARKLRDAGITTTEALLQQGATRQGRREIAEKTGIREELILRWVNHVDLARIKGIEFQYAELLEAAGGDSVSELARRDPANLEPRLAEVNEQRKPVRRLP